ncbi:PREDICTED: RILP-like protein 1 isoform X1 [Priapulus caudatus]|uniref:RILP-like protein 1 isoform X1 n=1 Tax=Priapulus caudatus TaxID=37621 RepID=A0ABM1F9Q1_PRICU|nr:PREDICTED: RILP-like protein 1 isoform X1 [Priapulus caudatus]
MDFENVADITVVDVYESAAAIGKEFEKIIELYGSEAITDLMPKVIRVLEQLEALAQRNERENAQIGELQITVQKLESEKVDKIAERLKYEMEMEQMEESWKLETTELMQTIRRLQEENKRLSIELAETEGEESQKPVETILNEQEWTMVTKLKDSVEKQREQLRQLEKALSQKSQDVESIEAHVDRVTKVCRDLRRKNRLVQKHGRMAVEEKADLEAQLQDKLQQINRLKGKLGITVEEANVSLQTQLLEHEEQAICLRAKLGIVAISEISTPDLEGKMLIDLKDPDRPRFTLNELRQILWERNELKSKLMEMEEELEQYRPCSLADDLYEGDAQGPINKEPLEKLYPMRYQKSGIKRFFRFFFGEESPFTSAKSSPVHQPRAIGIRSSSSPEPRSQGSKPSSRSGSPSGVPPASPEDQEVPAGNEQ